MHAFKYSIAAVGTVLWCAPFVIGFVRTKRKPFQLDRTARWGMVLECVAYSLLWQGAFWLTSADWWRITLSLVFFSLACLLSWTCTHALGKQWRVDAALGPEHALVRSGPYRIIRHPIYTSMLCVLLGTGFVVTSLTLLLVAVIVFFIGTEIRMRVEDRLLQSAFGKQFKEYEQTVPRLIPFFK